MYSPPYNRVADRAQQIELMRANNFAILVTAIDGELAASHLVCMVEQREVGQEQVPVVVGHMAKTNPQWQAFFDADVMVVFHGPHAYVSPRWYVQQERVPTWNYAAVHAYGKPRVIEAREAKHAVMRRLVALQDPQWLPKFEALAPEYVGRMLDGIVPFEIEVTRLETRWKLSQNRGRREQELIIAELEKSPDSAARATAALTAGTWQTADERERALAVVLRDLAATGNCDAAERMVAHRAGRMRRGDTACQYPSHAGLLGDVSPGRAKRLAECARRAGGAAHSIALEEARYWKHNRVVWAGPRVIPPALGTLAESLNRELIAADFPTEAREFNAHVTLIRQARLPRTLPGLPTIAWQVNELVLVRTQLSSTGSSYAVMEQFALT